MQSPNTSFSLLCWRNTLLVQLKIAPAEPRAGERQERGGQGWGPRGWGPCSCSPCRPWPLASHPAQPC